MSDTFSLAAEPTQRSTRTNNRICRDPGGSIRLAADPPGEPQPALPVQGLSTSCAVGNGDACEHHRASIGRRPLIPKSAHLRVRHRSGTGPHKRPESHEPDGSTTRFWLCDSGRNGRYWARTSDPQLVDAGQPFVPVSLGSLKPAEIAGRLRTIGGDVVGSSLTAVAVRLEQLIEESVNTPQMSFLNQNLRASIGNCVIR